jgi:type I restriction enzyme M protein
LTLRHHFEPGDWASVAQRLDEVLRAHQGGEVFDEAHRLLVAKLAHEMDGDGEFLDVPPSEMTSSVNDWIQAAKRRWPGVIDASLCGLSGATLQRCAEVLRTVSLHDTGLVGLDSIFEFMVAKSAKAEKGQYFTPRQVVRAVTSMACVQPTDRVIDPACGSGAFLREASIQAPGCPVRGYDLDPRAVRVAQTLLAASGLQAGAVSQADSLLSGPTPASFDVVLTNPPFAGDVGHAYARAFTLTKRHRVERDVLFIERCVALLRPGGRLAMVLPTNKMGGARWDFVREWLLRHVQVVAVLSLGRATFQPHTSQKASVLLAVKRGEPLAEPASDEDVLFFVSDEDAASADVTEAIPQIRQAMREAAS